MMKGTYTTKLILENFEFKFMMMSNLQKEILLMFMSNFLAFKSIIILQLLTCSYEFFEMLI